MPNMSDTYIVMFTVEVEHATSHDDAAEQAIKILDESPEIAEVFKTERCWILE